MHPLQNELISKLSSADQDLIVKNSRLIEIKAGDVLLSPLPEQPLIYFITSGAVALFVSFQAAQTETGLAVGLVGREGALGLQAALGFGVENLKLIVQSSGFSYVMEAQRLKQLMKRHPDWLMVFSKYLWTIYQDIARLAALSHVHDIKRRLADWLVMSDNRCDHEALVMTHEHIAHMLGVRRSSITLAARQMKLLGLIDYSRGNIKLLNKPALETLAAL